MPVASARPGEAPRAFFSDDRLAPKNTPAALRGKEENPTRPAAPLATTHRPVSAVKLLPGCPALLGAAPLRWGASAGDVSSGDGRIGRGDSALYHPAGRPQRPCDLNPLSNAMSTPGPIYFPLAIRPSPAPLHAAAAWFVPGGGAGAWLAELVGWGVPMTGVRLYPLPTSVRDRRAIGALVTTPQAPAPRSVRRAQPYGRVAGRLYLPADARLDPPVSDAELLTALRWGRVRAAPFRRPRRV